MAASSETLEQFQATLDKTDDAEELDIFDFSDADNLGALIVHLCKRRRAGAKGPAHVVLVGQPFSATTAPGVTNLATRTVAVEDAAGVKSEVDLKTFGGSYVKEKFGEPRDPQHERYLFEINTARFRAVLRDAGFDGSEYIFYDGGISERAGISFFAHCQEWKGLVDEGKTIMEVSNFEGRIRLATAAELNEFKAVWFGWSCEARVAYFKACRNALSADLRAVDPLLPDSSSSSPKKSRTRPTLVELAERGATFRVYSGSPLVELPGAVKPRVEYVAAMFGVMDAKKTLCGNNFNTATAYQKALDLVQGEYTNARVVLFPTDFFKTPQEVCTLDAAAIAGLVDGSKPNQWLAALVKQWTDMNVRGVAQPLFDVAVFFDLVTCARQFKIFEAGFELGENEHAVGTPFERCGMKIVHRGAAKTWLSPQSPFPKGFYCLDAYDLAGVEGLNFEKDARSVLPDFLRRVFS
jgi:hypothetical protein